VIYNASFAKCIAGPTLAFMPASACKLALPSHDEYAQRLLLDVGCRMAATK